MKKLNTTIIILFWMALVTNAQTKTLETQSISGGLVISTNSIHELESVVGEISGAQMTGLSKRLYSGHARTSHSPGVVSDLIVSTNTVGEGEILLGWTHTGNDGNIGQAGVFYIKVATFQITNANFAGISSALNVTALIPGTTSERTISNLSDSQLYYMAIRAKNSANIYGRVSPNSTFYVYTIAPDPISSLSVISSSAGQINISWNVTGDDGNTGDLNPGVFRIDYSSDPLHSFSKDMYVVQIDTVAAALSEQFYHLSDLLGNVTYFATVYIGDEISVYSGLSSIGEIVTMAYPPAISSFSAISTGSFTANFTANNNAGTQYQLEISTYSNFSSVINSGWQASISINFGGLTPKTTYYVRGKSRNFSNIETQFADFGSVVLDSVSGTYKPKIPFSAGARSGSNFTISWDAIVENINGNTTAISRYDLYTSTASKGVKELLVSLSSNTLSYSETVSAAKWYWVSAVDIYNNESAQSWGIKNYDEVAMTVSDDEEAYLDIPKSVSNVLSNNKLLPIVLNQPEKEKGSVLSSYKLYFKDESENIILNRDFSDNVTLVLPVSNVSGSQSASIKTLASYSAYDYAIYHDNGVEDVKLGGTVNSDGTVSIITKKTGTFEVKRVIRAQGFVITQTVPRKIFTPNGDGIWDDFHIIFENPEGLAITGAKVYDLRGTEIAKLVSGTYNSEASLLWDGKKDGSVVKSGIYVYQFKAGDKYYSGTMVLAR